MLNTKFEVLNLGKLDYFLRIHVRKHLYGLFLDQQFYSVNLLSINGFGNLKPLPTSMQANTDFQTVEQPISNPTKYQRIVSSLQLQTVTLSNQILHTL